MKPRDSILLGIAALALALGPIASFADEAPAPGPSGAPKHWHHKHGGDKGRGGFMMGVCVGQNLAAAGVTLPKHVPGQKPAWDDATKAAFKKAAEACRSQFGGKHGGGASEDSSSE